MSKAERVIAITGLLVASVGVISSIASGKSFPSARFWIGLGLVYVFISALAEWEPAVAEPLSLAILTTVLLSDATQGVLGFVQSRQELKTSPPSQTPTAPAQQPSPPHPGKPPTGGAQAGAARLSKVLGL